MCVFIFYLFFQSLVEKWGLPLLVLHLKMKEKRIKICVTKTTNKRNLFTYFENNCHYTLWTQIWECSQTKECTHSHTLTRQWAQFLARIYIIKSIKLDFHFSLRFYLSFCACELFCKWSSLDGNIILWPRMKMTLETSFAFAFECW